MMKDEITLRLALQPHTLDFSKAPEEFDNKDSAKIWKRATEYPRLREHPRRFVSHISLQINILLHETSQECFDDSDDK